MTLFHTLGSHLARVLPKAGASECVAPDGQYSLECSATGAQA